MCVSALGAPASFRLSGKIRAFALAALLLTMIPGLFPSQTIARDAAWANGCGGELAGRWDVVCPASPDVAAYIGSVRAWHGGVSIGLTGAGIELGLTCEGAAAIVVMASGEYARLPVDVREYDNLFWADPYITAEVNAHAFFAATSVPQLASRGNPIDIVFSDYWTPGSQGLLWSEFNNPDFFFNPGICPGNV
jgi:hypothetical protein